MPIKELISFALILFAGICITHPMNTALALRRVELSILKDASNTRSWGIPVVFPEKEARKPVRHRNFKGVKNRKTQGARIYRRHDQSC